MPNHIRARVILAIAGATAAVALTGCSVISTGNGTAPSASSSGSNSSGVAYATAQLKNASADPAFVAPGPAFDASKAKGKSVWFIPNSSSIPFTLAVQKAFSAIAVKAGIKLTVWPSTGNPTDWVQGINQAIAQKADLVVMAAPPQLVGPQLADLKTAGIPVVVPHQYDPTMTLPANVTAFEYAPFLDAANLMADQSIVDTKGKADTLVITTNESPPSQPMADSITAEYKKHCPGCTLTDVNVPVADWGTKMQSTVQAALLRDPKMNYIITIFDSATQFVIPGITAAGKTGTVGLASFNNTPFALTNVQNGAMNMDVGESINWIGYASMDQVLRILSGVKPAKDESAALRVFTKANASVLGTPADNEKGYSDSYVAAYEKLWGLK